MGIKTRARAGEPLLGILLRMPAEELIEMAAITGFDFIVVDCEHGPADVLALRTHLALAELHGVPVLVRVGSAEPALVLRALDQGAAGILAPHIDSEADARALVDAVHYPPLGCRGFATYPRSGRFGLVDPAAHQRRMIEETLVIGMIESPAAVAAAGAIVEVPGMDAIMIGKADLRASSPPGDDLSTAVAQVNRTLIDHNTLRMDIVPGPVEAAAAFVDGADLVVYNLAHTLMRHLAELKAVSRT